MFSRLYTVFIAPRQRDRDLRNREIVLNTLLSGTLLLLAVGLLIMLGTYAFLGHTYVLKSMAVVVFAGAFVGGLHWLSRSGRFRTSASLLVGFYCLLASMVIMQWGIITPTGVLMFGLVIVLAGILLGPNYSLYFAGGLTVVLVALQAAAVHHVIHTDWSWLAEPPEYGDVFGSALIFAVLALVSWTFNFQMERSLHRAVQAEKALKKQKDMLETTVEERTSELQAVQLEKIQQMYRFAELGQLSTAMLHDLANHLTTLTLDIESLEGKTRSAILSRAKRSIRYIDDMVVQVRDQLHGRSHVRPFSINSDLEAITQMLQHRAAAAGITIALKVPADKKQLRCRGEPIRFRQLIANLISNAIDAYDGVTTSPKREVSITVGANATHSIITITDWGKGIPEKERAKLFEPFYSTKKTGMGMGLYIVKQIIEEHFLGSVSLDDAHDRTTFVITLPKA